MEIAFQEFIGCVNQLKGPIFGVLSMICSFVLGKFLSRHTTIKKGGLSSMLETQKYCISCNVIVDLPEWAFNLINKGGVSVTEFISLLTVNSGSNDIDVTIKKQIVEAPKVKVKESDLSGD